MGYEEAFISRANYTHVNIYRELPGRLGRKKYKLVATLPNREYQERMVRIALIYAHLEPWGA